MTDHTLEINTALQIAKPVHEVFEAIVDPAKMSNYFISKSTGRMEEGETILMQGATAGAEGMTDKQFKETMEDEELRDELH